MPDEAPEPVARPLVDLRPLVLQNCADLQLDADAVERAPGVQRPVTPDRRGCAVDDSLLALRHPEGRARERQQPVLLVEGLTDDDLAAPLRG